MLDFILSLARCFGCDESPDRTTFPLCRSCAESLIPSPELCSCCGSPACLGEPSCLRPWASLSPLKSLHARYLCAGVGYEVLKRWKWHHGPSLDRIILNSVPDPVLELCRGAWVVPLPQRLERSIELGGSPAEKIARWVSSRAERKHGMPIPAIRALEPEHTLTRMAQARLKKEQRLERHRVFAPGSCDLEGRKILLVDDFLTTGRTLQAAAQALIFAGATEVHGFCLGIRPTKGWMAPQAHWDDPWPIPSPQAKLALP